MTTLFQQVEKALRSKPEDQGVIVFDFESARVLAVRDPDLTSPKPGASVVALNAPEQRKAPPVKIRCKVCGFRAEKSEVWAHQDTEGHYG